MPCPLALLVPHNQPMRMDGNLLQAAIGKNADLECLVEATAPLTGPFVDQDRVIPEYCIELLAQSIAAGHGFLACRDGQPASVGMLAAVDHFSWHGQVEPEDRLQVHVQTEMTFGDVQVLTGKVNRANAVLAEGRLKISTQSDAITTEIPQPISARKHDGHSMLQALRSTALQNINRENTGIVAGTFHFRPDFPGFQGHFPGKPILPAVAQCAAVQILVEQFLQAKLSPIKFEALKWTRPILPGETVTITTSIAQNGERVSATFSITGHAGRTAGGVVQYLRRG